LDSFSSVFKTQLHLLASAADLRVQIWQGADFFAGLQIFSSLKVAGPLGSVGPGSTYIVSNKGPKFAGPQSLSRRITPIHKP
jgi:hypothetical protein